MNKFFIASIALLFIITANESICQSRINKSYIIDNNGSVLLSEGEGRLLLRSSEQDSLFLDTVRIYPNPRDPFFNKHPVVWDYSDGFLFQTSVFISNTGQPIFQLDRFLIDSVNSYFIEERQSFFPPPKSRLDKGGLPIDRYYGEKFLFNNAMGDCYYDMWVDKDTLIQVLFKQKDKIVEFWNFEHFEMVDNTPLTSEDKTRKGKEKAWRLVGTINVPADFLPPVNVFKSKGRFLLMSGDYQLYKIENNTLVSVFTFRNTQIEDVTLIVDKRTEEIYYADRKELLNGLGIDKGRGATQSYQKIDID
ncbi:MAG: hypothetical protein R2792_06635 [Saprospiraceae bacterium]